jgi:hypothetical protein
MLTGKGFDLTGPFRGGIALSSGAPAGPFCALAPQRQAAYLGSSLG